MMLRFWSLICSLFVGHAGAQQIAFETDPLKNTTATYDELISFYSNIAKTDARAQLVTIGSTDIGKPLHLLILSADKDFDPKRAKEKGKAVLLVNNGIHPGEPEGMDASMLFVRELLATNALPKNVVICVVPVYNVAGMLNRGLSRANQNGPTAYGFRGSRQHYDLNRDFIKSDTRNSWLFQQLFNTWDPDVFFDTHTSNGADYQYVMTLITSHRDKMHPDLASLMEERFTKPLYTRMAKAGFPMIPYVDPKDEVPASGLLSFLESPRYSTGYAALHHTIGYMPETHMWKSYEARVRSMFTLLKELLAITVQEQKLLVSTRQAIKHKVKTQEDFVISWKMDNNRLDSLPFLGYKSGYKKSEVSRQDRLYYDRDKPTSEVVPYYSRYNPDMTIKKPDAYVIPQAYDKVIALLQLNGVAMHTLPKDTVMQVEVYYIDDYKTAKTPYEGHYPHRDVQVRPVARALPFYKGDVVIEMNQAANRYIVETLEPQATDSFFNWNFFDAILSQKEYFSAYVFEEEAVRLLRENPAWKLELDEAKKQDPSLAASGRLQLEWIYKRSDYYEKEHLMYPIARLHAP